MFPEAPIKLSFGPLAIRGCRSAMCPLLAKPSHCTPRLVTSDFARMSGRITDPARSLGSYRGLLQVLGVGDADGRFGFEWTVETQLFCPFAHLGEYLLGEQADAGH